MDNVFSQWKVELAQRVCELVRDSRVLARFKRHFVAFRREKKQDEAAHAQWLRRRKKHCEKGLRTIDDYKERSREGERLNADLASRARARPSKDKGETWVWDWYQALLDIEELARLGSPGQSGMMIGFWCWVPPDLSLGAAPLLSKPDLLARFGVGTLHSKKFGTYIQSGVPTLAEKYASLAQIHDAFFYPDREPIEDLRDIADPTLIFTLANMVEGARELGANIHREALRCKVVDLPDSVAPKLREWLLDVEADLAKKMKQDHLNDDMREEIPQERPEPAFGSDRIVNLAWRIDALVRRPEAMEVFRARVRDFAAAGRGLRALTQARTLDEQYAVLAAIHDRVCCNTEPLVGERAQAIDPWQDSEIKLDPAGVLYYNLLCTPFQDMRLEHLPVLEAFFAQVEADIQANIAGRSAAGGKGGMRDQAPPVLNSDELEQYVTLAQAAACVNRVPRTIERKSGIPDPDIRGGHGKPHEWKWSTIRPWLETTFARMLPERFPSDRFVHR